ncbi:hypothetical protein N657DRAFT_480230 [Parathielavia appendiculata]|uniref:DUF2470 domain-containing protein n=1 Tax=Parathielavia appendiculata TaxID=2587402 RepID=A0AAN6Z2P1_9PEZI|nr:hypothetical protein N657DRAFT_480230 [Parathielavia appendiculata]
MIPHTQKARTLAHMNSDHRRDMRYILLHYPAIPPAPASLREKEEEDGDDPIMLDISLSSITLRLPGSDTTHSVAFDPPLADWGERRARLVEMTRSARAALGISEEGADEGDDSTEGKQVVVVSEYMPPRAPYDLAIIIGVLVYSACFGLICAGLVERGTAVGRVVEAARFPGGLRGFTWFVRDVLFWPTLVVHSTETWWLERSRLRQYGVKRGSKVWWLWMGSVFVEGFMVFKRFDIVVQRLRAQAKKRQ